MRFYWLTLGILAVWRDHASPECRRRSLGSVGSLPAACGRRIWGSLLDCFYCLSLWIAAPFAYGLGNDWKERLLLWPALSAGAILADGSRAIRVRNQPPPAIYYEEPEENQMSCCGNKRAEFQAQHPPDSRQGRPAGRPFPRSAQPLRVVFEYSGRPPMVVVGPVCGNRYRFDGAGSRVEVDPRDRRSLAVTPRLRQIV